MSYSDLKKLEGNARPKPKVGLQGTKQTVRVSINTPGLAVTFNFDLIISPAPDDVLRRMMWEIQQELSKRGAKAS